MLLTLGVFDGCSMEMGVSSKNRVYAGVMAMIQTKPVKQSTMKWRSDGPSHYQDVARLGSRSSG
jgi:hypothetical protein